MQLWGDYLGGDEIAVGHGLTVRDDDAALSLVDWGHHTTLIAVAQHRGPWARLRAAWDLLATGETSVWLTFDEAERDILASELRDRATRPRKEEE